jgi:hypothetical protein
MALLISSGVSPEIVIEIDSLRKFSNSSSIIKTLFM